MSAIPDDMLTWESDYGSNYDLGNTQSTDYSTTPINDGLPDNVINVSRSDGITWSGVLGAATAGADTLTKVFSTVYNLQSKAEDAKYQRTLNETNQQIRMAEAAGSLEVKRAVLDANVQIEKSKAARAVADQQARTASGSAGYVQTTSKMSPMLILGGLAVLGAGWYLFKGK